MINAQPHLVELIYPFSILFYFIFLQTHEDCYPNQLGHTIGQIPKSCSIVYVCQSVTNNLYAQSVTNNLYATVSHKQLVCHSQSQTTCMPQSVTKNLYAIVSHKHLVCHSQSQTSCMP